MSKSATIARPSIVSQSVESIARPSIDVKVSRQLQDQVLTSQSAGNSQAKY